MAHPLKTNMNNCKPLETCLACGSDYLQFIIDLCPQPLANSFTVDDRKQEEYPLAIHRCLDCSHLQLTHVVDPSVIYENYSYVSGTSKTYTEYMKWFANYCSEYVGKKNGSVLDIGCNDGSQLDVFKLLGFDTYGVDPAKNIHPISTAKGHKVVCGFWDEQSVGNLDKRQFDIVVAQNSFAHNPDPLTYLTLLRPLLADDGLFFIQTSQADMVKNGEFDTIYHEHVNFYNVNSMNELCKRAGLYLIDVIKTPVHGTSYVFVLSKKNLRPANVQNLIQMEDYLKLDLTYVRWGDRIDDIESEFREYVKSKQDSGYKLVGYGASAKGNTLLNFTNVKLDYIIDDNPLKQNTYSPGMRIPVVSSSILDSIPTSQPILFIPLAWNLYDEIKRKIKSIRSGNSDRFLKYFPEVQIDN